MDVTEALAHANCSAALSASPAHVAEALQVLAARVAELEAEREATGTEWGVRWPLTAGGGVTNYRQNEAAARHTLDFYYWGDHELVKRSAPGPWRVAT